MFRDISPWVSCVSAQLTAEAMATLCSRLSFKNIYTANSLKKCLPPEQKAGMAAGHHNISISLTYSSILVIHPTLQCRQVSCNFFSVPWKLAKKCYYCCCEYNLSTSDLGVLCLLPVSVNQANLLASGRLKNLKAFLCLDNQKLLMKNRENYENQETYTLQVNLRPSKKKI